MKRLALIFIVCGITNFWTSCSFSEKSQFTRNKPKDSDLFGIYKPDAKTQKLIVKQNDYPTATNQIILCSDGRILFIDMLDWWKDAAGYHKQLASGNGIWEGSLDLDGKCWQIVSYPENFFHVPLHLVGQKPPYKIVLYDPDREQFMFFENTKN